MPHPPLAMNPKSPQLAGQTPELAHELECLEARVCALSDNLHKLHEELFPVLRPAASLPASDSEIEGARPAMAPLSEFVRDIRGTVENLDARIHEIRQNLAVASN